jgi:hypothetical protein
MWNDNIFLEKLMIQLSKFTTAFMLLPIFCGFLKWKYLNRPLKIFLWYCIAKLFVNLLHQGFIWATGYFRDIAVPLLNKYNITDTSFMGIFAYLTNFAFLGWYFYKVIPHEKIAQGVRWLSTGLFVFAIIDYLFIENFRYYGVFNPTASAIFCFLLPLIHLWFLYREDSRVPLSKNPYFWIGMGLLMPNLVGCFLHFTGNALNIEDFPLFAKISIGKMFLDMIGQIFLAIGFNYARYSQFLPLREE